MNDIPNQNRVGDNSPQATASAHVGVGIFLAIAAFGISCLALGASIPVYFQSRDTRAELLQEIQQSENRVLADNREKTTALTLLDSHYRELKAKFDAQENLNVRRR